MPQTIRYGLIINEHSSHMQSANSVTGENLTEDEKSKLSSYEALMKRMFFACEQCGGALIQIATCRFCKATIRRKCRDCELEISVSHRRCPKRPEGSLAPEFIRRGRRFD